MRKIKEILRLKCEMGMSYRAIARSCYLSHGAVSNYLARAEIAGISWSLPEDLDEASLEALLFPGNRCPFRNRTEIDFAWVR